MNTPLFEPTILGVCIGILAGAAFVIICWRRQVAPNFSHMAVIVLSCVGAVVSIHFGYVVLKTPKEQLGLFQEQRLPMILGALAVIWVSVESVIKTFLSLIRVETSTATENRIDAREKKDA
jgi:ABC-type Fe3+-siderophore transport system permease subunit